MQIRPTFEIIYEDQNEGEAIFHNASSSILPHYSYMHYHTAIEIGIVTKGSGIFFIEDKVLPFNLGDISIVLPGEIHITNSSESDKSVWEFILVELDSFFQDMPDMLLFFHQIVTLPQVNGNVYKNGEYPELFQQVQALCKEIEEKKENYQTMVKCILIQIMVFLSRHRLSTEEKTSVGKKKRNDILPAISYLLKQYQKTPTTPFLANLCYMSETNFRRIFKSVTGFSPLEYLYHIRVNAAIALLYSQTMSITAIAYEVGYVSLTSFHRHFKKYKGVSPKLYLKKKGM